MTIKEMFDEYAGAYMQVNGCPKDAPNCKMCVEDTERMAEIIKELEASIRKDTIEDILKSTRTVIKDCFEVEEIFVGDIREYAKANGINL